MGPAMVMASYGSRAPLTSYVASGAFSTQPWQQKPPILFPAATAGSGAVVPAAGGRVALVPVSAAVLESESGTDTDATVVADGDEAVVGGPVPGMAVVLLRTLDPPRGEGGEGDARVVGMGVEGRGVPRRARPPCPAPFPPPLLSHSFAPARHPEAIPRPRGGLCITLIPVGLTLHGHGQSVPIPREAPLISPSLLDKPSLIRMQEAQPQLLYCSHGPRPFLNFLCPSWRVLSGRGGGGEGQRRQPD